MSEENGCFIKKQKTIFKSQINLNIQRPNIQIFVWIFEFGLLNIICFLLFDI